MAAEFLKTYSTPELRMDCPEDPKFRLVREVVESLEKRAADEGFRDHIDGARVA